MIVKVRYVTIGRMFTLYHILFYKPLYNGLIALLSIVPGGDVGIAVVLFTVLVKLILFPLSARSLRPQKMMKAIEPELAAIKEKYKDDKAGQSQKVMALYKEKQINPFSGVFLVPKLKKTLFEPQPVVISEKVIIPETESVTSNKPRVTV